MSKYQYFEPVEQIPKRTNVKLFAKIIQEFLDSGKTKGQIKPEIFEDKSHNYRTTALQRYVRVHNIPIRVSCINDVIYLEKV